MTAHEDGPPCVIPRQHGEDVVSWGNRICADKRGDRLRKDFAAQLPYQVHYGTCHQHTQHFSAFDRALEFLIDHVDDEFQPLLVGASFDAERSGLTDDEEEARAAALEMRTPRNARRA